MNTVKFSVQLRASPLSIKPLRVHFLICSLFRTDENFRSYTLIFGTELDCHTHIKEYEDSFKLPKCFATKDKPTCH